MRTILCVAASVLLVFALNGCGGGGCPTFLPTWSVTRSGNVVGIAYGSGSKYPEYAALHVDSSYFRMNTGPDSGWGTSVVLLPSFWSGGVYHQGGPISYAYETDGTDLLVTVNGTVSGLHTSGQIRLSPPSGDTIQAKVTMNTTGSVDLDSRPGEAFKPLMLSSMHISSTMWDAQSAYIGATSYSIPASGWIVDPPVAGTVFGLKGGTSSWKIKAPTVEISMPDSLPVTGWVTGSSDPNDDNIGFWPASDTVLRSWQYDIVAKPAG